MKLKIQNEFEPVLRKVSEAVGKITPKTHKLVDDMFETMYAANGIGLAAPQVGVLKRVIVVDLRRRGSTPLALINPVITCAEGEQANEEGCLSCPGLWATVKRADKVAVRALDTNGNVVELTAGQMFAAVLQHEIDHLDGVLFVDRLEPAERVKVERLRQEMLRM